MTSTFSGLEIGKRSITAHQTAISTTGHNLSNLDTEGYSRQRVEFSTFDPIYLPGMNREETPGQIGQGVIIERVERIRDELLDKRIIAEENHEGYWETRNQRACTTNRPIHPSEASSMSFGTSGRNSRFILRTWLPGRKLSKAAKP